MAAKTCPGFAPTRYGGVSETRFVNYSEWSDDATYAVDFTVKSVGTAGAYAWALLWYGPRARWGMI